MLKEWKKVSLFACSADSVLLPVSLAGPKALMIEYELKL